MAPPVHWQHVARELEHPVNLPNELLAPKGHHLQTVGYPSVAVPNLPHQAAVVCFCACIKSMSHRPNSVSSIRTS